MNCQPPRSHQWPKRFTVLELLMVIAIILILMSLIQPQLLRARAAAYQVTCMNNLKQLHTYHLLYAKDFKDNPVSIDTRGSYLVYENFGESGASGLNILNKNLNYYIEPNLTASSKLKVVECPSKTGFVTQTAYKYAGTSYVTNIGYHDTVFASHDSGVLNNNPPTTRLSQVQQPGKMSLVHEWGVYLTSTNNPNPYSLKGHKVKTQNHYFNFVTVNGAGISQVYVPWNATDYGAVSLTNLAP